MLSAARGDAIIVGASKAGHLAQNLAAAAGGPLPDGMAEAFDRAWAVCRTDAPEYFTLFKAKK
jgi:aflatoxin B1 aldehyde reductase